MHIRVLTFENDRKNFSWFPCDRKFSQRQLNWWIVEKSFKKKIIVRWYKSLNVRVINVHGENNVFIPVWMYLFMWCQRKSKIYQTTSLNLDAYAKKKMCCANIKNISSNDVFAKIDSKKI